MDVHLPHKVGRQIQLIQHRENEYKSERVNSARVFYFIYIYMFRLVLILIQFGAYTYGSNTLIYHVRFK